ncbi:hypothetical protein DFH06DRAFT_1119419 [Mycena polygramma]|nr:hypothetical protein DFH06DRAFT_1119419 [Mycena polygramma]
MTTVEWRRGEERAHIYDSNGMNTEATPGQRFTSHSAEEVNKHRTRTRTRTQGTGRSGVERCTREDEGEEGEEGDLCDPGYQIDHHPPNAEAITQMGKPSRTTFQLENITARCLCLPLLVAPSKSAELAYPKTGIICWCSSSSLQPHNVQDLNPKGKRTPQTDHVQFGSPYPALRFPVPLAGLGRLSRNEPYGKGRPETKTKSVTKREAGEPTLALVSYGRGGKGEGAPPWGDGALRIGFAGGVRQTRIRTAVGTGGKGAAGFEGRTFAYVSQTYYRKHFVYSGAGRTVAEKGVRCSDKEEADQA